MPDSASPLALEAKNLSKHFGSRKALRDVSFELKRGQSLAVVGPNGAGKTTLLRVLALLDKPSSGTFEVCGADACEDPDSARARIGFISHMPMLYLDLTAQENLEFFGRLYGVHDARARADEMLDKMELSHRKTDRVRSFSRGMLQRVAIARALVHDPEILLFDEPFTGLDPRASRVIENLLASKPNDVTCVTVSHDLRRSYENSTHVMVMSRGRKVLWGRNDTLGFDELCSVYEEQMGSR